MELARETPQFVRLTTAQVDAVDWLKSLPSGSVDLIVTDPPYESLEKHRKKGTTTRLKDSKSSSNKWFSIFENARFPEFFDEAYRVLGKNSHLYIMCDEETLRVVAPMGEAAGFTFWKGVVVDKERMGMGYHYRNQTERVAFFEKGKRKLNSMSIPDILRFKFKRDGYPTEKPEALFKLLIEQSTNEGEVVADPFFGSGNSLLAALESDRIALGNDLSDDAHDYLLTSLESRRVSLMDEMDQISTRHRVMCEAVRGRALKGV